LNTWIPTMIRVRKIADKIISTLTETER